MIRACWLGIHDWTMWCKCWDRCPRRMCGHCGKVSDS